MSLYLSRRRLMASIATAVALLALPATSRAADKPLTLKVGVIPGPEETLAEVARDVAKRHGLNVELVRFSNYALPNEALVSGDIDANAFQDTPFMDAQVDARGYKIVAIGKTWVEPMGFYSKKYKSAKDLPKGARIGVPNDPSNQSRALVVLNDAGLIKLDPKRQKLASLADIIENPHGFKIMEIDGAQLARALDDLDMAAVNTTFILSVKMDSKKPLLQEPVKDNPHANIIVVRKSDENRPGMKTLVESFHSDEVRKTMLEKFPDAILPAW